MTSWNMWVRQRAGIFPRRRGRGYVRLYHPPGPHQLRGAAGHTESGLRWTMLTISAHPYRTFIAYRSAAEALNAGVTTVRTVGMPNNIDLGLRDAINKTMFFGPSILAAGPTYASHRRLRSREVRPRHGQRLRCAAPGNACAYCPGPEWHYPPGQRQAHGFAERRIPEGNVR